MELELNCMLQPNEQTGHPPSGLVPRGPSVALLSPRGDHANITSKLRDLEKETSGYHGSLDDLVALSQHSVTIPSSLSPSSLTNAKNNNKASMDPSDFECSLCFRLFCKPVSTCCGHSFCRSCLLAALRYNLCCPLCRTKLDSPTKFKYSVNITIKTLLEKHFKEEYQQREKEEEEKEEEPCRIALASEQDTEGITVIC